MQESIFEQNMKSLKARFPGLAYRIEEHMYKLEEEYVIQCEHTKDLDYTLKFIKDNRILYTNGKYGALQKTKLLVDDLGKLNQKATIFLLGIGNGMILKELLRNTKDSINIAVFEPSVNIFIKAMETIDLHEIFDKRAIGLVINGLNGEERDSIISSFLTIGNVSYMKKIIHPNYEEMFETDIIEYLKAIQKIIDKIIISENTSVAFSSVLAENVFKNIRYICDNYKGDQICRVIPLDIPAIVVAAGPSLNKNIKELKKAKNKAFIIAVDTALKPLINSGIEPDLFVMVDALKPIDLFQAKGVENIPMLASIFSSSVVFEFHKGRKFYYREYIEYINKLFEDFEIPFRRIPSGGSVATTAFAFAYLSGFSTIILVGQDLALTDNKTHADGTFQEKMKKIDTSQSIMVEGNIEPLVPTKMDLKVFLDWYNDYIAQTEGVRIINATEGGAKIKNTEVMTLKEAINKECRKTVDIHECYEKLEPMFSEEQRIKAIEYFHSTPEMLNEVKKKAIEGKKLYKKLITMGRSKNINKEKYRKLSKKITKNVDEIEDMPIAPIVLECLGVANYLIRSEVYEEEESFEKEIKEIARKGSKVLDYVIQCVEWLLPLVEETVCKIK